ncbi:TniQ family protein [Advenella kashmirensis]
MNLAPFSRYIVRPHSLPGESILGYIYRYMSANGHVLRENGYYQTAKKMLLARSINQFEKCFDILSQAIDDDRLMGSIFWRDYKYLNFGVSEKLMSFRVHTVWYCPHCLCENEYHLSCWQVFGIHSCPYHGILLSSTCPECGKTLAWISLFPNWSCSCGCRLTDRTTNVRKVHWTIQERDPIQYLSPHLRPSAKYVDNFYTFKLDQTEVIKLVVAKDSVENRHHDECKHTSKAGTRLVFQFIRYLYFWQRKDLGYQRTQNIDLTFLMLCHKNSGYTREKIDCNQSTAFCICQRDHFSIHFIESIPESTCAAFVEYCAVWWNRNCHKLKNQKTSEAQSQDYLPIPAVSKNSEHKVEQIFELLENLLIVAILGYDVEDLDKCKSHWIIPDATSRPSNSSPLSGLIDYFMRCTEERLGKWNQYLKEDLKRLECKFEFTYLGFLN